MSELLVLKWVNIMNLILFMLDAGSMTRFKIYTDNGAYIRVHLSFLSSVNVLFFLCDLC